MTSSKFMKLKKYKVHLSIFLIIILLISNLFFIYVFNSKYNFSINNNKLSITKKSLDNIKSFVYTSYYDFKLEYIPTQRFDKYGGIEIINNDLFHIFSNGEVAIHKQNEFQFLKINPVENYKSDFIRKYGDTDAFISGFGVRDTFYDNDKSSLFISSLEYDNDNDCYFISVFYIKINVKNLNYNYDKSWKKILSTEPCLKTNSTEIIFQAQSAGGRIQKLDDNYLLSVGDFNFHEGGSNINIYDDDNSDYSKIILFDLNGNKRHFSFGHRNPQGLVVFNSDSEKIIIETEHGPEGGDEVNLIRDLSHYGYPYNSYGTNYGEKIWSAKKNDYGYSFEDPILSLTPALGISELIFWNNDNIEKWKNDILISSLRAKAIYRLKLDKNYKPFFIEKITLNKRIRDLNYDDDGNIFILSDSLSETESPTIIKMSLIK